LVALGAVATSCSKTEGGKAAPAMSASAAAAGSGGPAASAGSAAAAGAHAGDPSSWAGSYTAKVGPVAPPDNAKEKTWASDPGTVAVGAGKVALTIAGARGDTQGELTGPLGDLKVAGFFDGKELRANVVPKDPKSDDAMTGFMLLTANGTPPSALKGTLRVSGRDAKIVREATVEVTKK
jgi:hypothetical protein